MLWLVPEKKQLRRQIGRLGQETVYQILSLQQADNSNKGTAKSEENEKYVQILDVLEEIRSEDGCLSLKDLAVNGNDLVKIGFSGRTIGTMLNWLLDQVMEETLPNDRETLLAWAQRVWSEAWHNS
jgi:tRNA nucleotidyltransferase (CCA-adding enzyme)